MGLNMLILMFMSPTSDIEEPLYGHQCYEDCATAFADGMCRIGIISKNCALTCDIPTIDVAPVDTLGTATSRVCFSELQSSIQLKLLIAALVAVPLLLFPIPFIEMYQHSKASKGSHAKLSDDDEDEVGGGGGHGEHGEEFSVGDAFIHQGIHTI